MSASARAYPPSVLSEVQLCFDAVGKGNQAAFTSHDFSQLAYHCGWVDTGAMDQGDITMIYLHVTERARDHSYFFGEQVQTTC